MKNRLLTALRPELKFGLILYQDPSPSLPVGPVPVLSNAAPTGVGPRESKGDLLIANKLRPFRAKPFLISALVILLTSFGANAQGKLKQSDILAIKKIEETYRTAWLKNDAETILGLFADDAVLMPNGNPMVRGKEAMRQFWFAPSETVTTINKYETSVEQIYGEKNLAYLVGTNELLWTMENKSKNDVKRYRSTGYFIVIYVKKGKEWKITRQSWSSKLQEVK
jgi:uncharacterized protein (TIGR02246 family)